MRRDIPMPIVIAVLAVVLLVGGFLLWRQSSPGARADQTEDMLRAAFGGGQASPGAGPGARPNIPPPPPGGPAGGQGGASSAPGPRSGPVR